MIEKQPLQTERLDFSTKIEKFLSFFAFHKGFPMLDGEL